jgi:hypothetical protein
MQYVVMTWLLKKRDEKMFWNLGGLDNRDGKSLIQHVVNEER